MLFYVAQKLNECFSPLGYVCRFGGDEFAAIITTPQTEEQLQSCVDAANEGLKTIDSDLPTVSVSAGIALLKKGMENKDLFKKADIALYKNKKS